MKVENREGDQAGRSTGLDGASEQEGWRFRTRFLPLLILLALVGPFLLSTWYTLVTQREILEGDFHTEMHRMVDVLADGMRDPVWNLIPESGAPLVDSFISDERVRWVRVTSRAQGNFVERGTRLAHDDPDNNVVQISREIMRDDGSLGEVSVQFDTSAMHAELDRQRSHLLLVGAVHLSLSLALVYFVFRFVRRTEDARLLRGWNRKLQQEIDERRQVEEALRQSEQRLGSIVEASPSAIFLKDVDGRYVLVNSRFCEWYGGTESEVLGRRTGDIFPAAQAEAYAAHDREVLETGEILSVDRKVRFVDGSQRHVVATKFPVRGASGEIVGVGTLNTDVTDFRQAEEKLRETQKFQALGQLTGGVAHDFNNLLAVILGNAELIEEDLAEGVPVDRQSLQNVYRAVTRGSELCQRLLAFSRRQPLAPRAVDPARLSAELRAMLQRTLGEPIAVDMTAAPGAWQVLADPGQLENAILNLAINARDAMPDGGALRITFDNLQVGAADRAETDLTPGDYVVLAVSDTGSGMAQETVKRAVEPFFTTKDVGQGSGLGLSMVYGFAKQSGGMLEIDSVPGEGTTVRIVLPRAAGGMEADEAQQGADIPRARGETVLLVEDDPDVRDLARRELESLGYKVVSAHDAGSGMQRFDVAEGCVDLLLCDIVLPGGKDGTVFAEELKRRWPDMRVVFMSGYADSAVRESLPESGYDLIDKPFRKQDLAQYLRAALDRQVIACSLENGRARTKRQRP